MEEKILYQTDSQGFYIGTTVNNCAGAIDTDEPIFDKKTEKAKWDSVNSTWIIKTISEWGQEEITRLEEQKNQAEEQSKIQAEIEQAKKITDFYEMAEMLGVKFI